MNYVFAIFLAAVRALSTFVAGKLVLVAFGTAAFAAHAQLSQLLAVLLPLSCGCTSLALMSALANGDTEQVQRVLKVSAWISAGLVVLTGSFVVAAGPASISQWVFGTPHWQPTAIIAPVAIVLACVASLGLASLIGIGKGRWASLVDAGMALCVVGIAAIAAAHERVNWLIYSPLPILGVGALASALALWLCRGMFGAAIARSQQTGKPAHRSLRSYMLASLVASAVAPLAILATRAALLDQSGANEASSFIAAQRLAALVAAPIPVYVYTFLSPFLASAEHQQASQRIRKLQGSILLLAGVAYAVLALSLPVVTPLAFSNEVHIPIVLFLFVAIGETGRVAAALRAQYLATHGQWRTFVGGEFVFLALFVGTFVAGSRDGHWIAGAYGIAGVGYLLYMVSWGTREPRGTTHGN